MSKGIEMLGEQIKKLIPPEVMMEIERLKVAVPEFATRAQDKLTSIDERLERLEYQNQLNAAQLDYIIQLIMSGAGTASVQELIDPAKDVLTEVTKLPDPNQLSLYDGESNAGTN